ncbi:MAG: hypothetical protein ACI9OH_000495 [Oleispira sp.]|jgi:hypothetical protein
MQLIQSYIEQLESIKQILWCSEPYPVSLNCTEFGYSRNKYSLSFISERHNEEFKVAVVK